MSFTPRDKMKKKREIHLGQKWFKCLDKGLIKRKTVSYKGCLIKKSPKINNNQKYF